ncbi:MAG: hypothetical protein M1142_05360 [Patescibacteria group bacterium]|nr:hypothetical protein [Patescibacteria group bacterium]
MSKERKANIAQPEEFTTYQNAFDYLYGKGDWRLSDTGAEVDGITLTLQSSREKYSGYALVTVDVSTPTSLESYRLDNRQHRSLKFFAPLIHHTDWLGNTLIVRGQTISQPFIENPDDHNLLGCSREEVTE